MVSIYEAYYRDNDKQELVDINNITVDDYNNKYKGHLFCTTTNCTAKLSYVTRDNNANHFRTWRESPHIESCIYFFEKTKSREGRRTEGEVTGTASDERIKRSLREAFALEMLSEAERNKRLERDREKRRIRRERERIRGARDISPVHRIVTNPDEINETTLSDGFRLFKKNADALQERDIGQTRTVTGILKNVVINNSTNCTVDIEKNNIKVSIKFEEAFFAANNRFIGMFHYIERYFNENNGLLFSATGEVRYNQKSNQYEIVVFNSIGFLVHGKSLESIAAEYSIMDNE
ncbi:hypothetical protein CHH62_13190 [Niallia circulans]|uniref:hypothetical protein n=1 Tax=Niallia circulans TaxID=1397 RepID=UPI000BA76948|nr:hypothetical protein [Niallia circulans]PAD25237.1 hypothetical protein CHH62_13190 [Niallia circulans]